MTTMPGFSPSCVIFSLRSKQISYGFSLHSSLRHLNIHKRFMTSPVTGPRMRPVIGVYTFRGYAKNRPNHVKDFPLAGGHPHTFDLGLRASAATENPSRENAEIPGTQIRRKLPRHNGTLDESIPREEG